MRNAQAYKNTENYFTTDFNLSHRINDILSDRNLSAQADRLLIRLINAAGRRGYCFPSLETLCSWVKLKPTQIRRYLRELESKRYIRIFEHAGHSNEYQIVDILPNIRRPLRFSEPIKEVLRTRKRYMEANVIPISHKKNIPNQERAEIMPNSTPRTNVEPVLEHISRSDNTKQSHKTEINDRPDPPPPPPAPRRARTKPIRFDLVKRILDITGDHKSFGLWVKFVRNAPLETVFMTIHSLEVALSCDQVSSPGRYMVGIIRNIYPELFNSSQTVSTRPDASPPPAPRRDPEPTVERDQELNIQKIREILKLLNGKKSTPFRTFRTFGKHTEIDENMPIIESDGFSSVDSINDSSI